MVAYWFKWEGTGYHGLAVGKNIREIFWLIDSHGDPYDALVKKVGESVSICVEREEDEEDEQPTCEVNYPSDFDKGWVKMEWPKDIIPGD